MSYWNESIPFDTLVGKTLGRITVAADGERISFITDDGEVYKSIMSRTVVRMLP